MMAVCLHHPPMTTPDNHGGFEFDPEQVDQIDKLAETFIEEEFDSTLLAQIDRDHLETLVERAETVDVTAIDEPAVAAAIEVAELVLERLEVFEE